MDLVKSMHARFSCCRRQEAKVYHGSRWERRNPLSKYVNTKHSSHGRTQLFVCSVSHFLREAPSSQFHGYEQGKYMKTQRVLRTSFFLSSLFALSAIYFFFFFFRRQNASHRVLVAFYNSRGMFNELQKRPEKWNSPTESLICDTFMKCGQQCWIRGEILSTVCYRIYCAGKVLIRIFFPLLIFLWLRNASRMPEMGCTV